MNYNLYDLISTEDTIVAISTPSGVGGIAIVRVSGPQAIVVSDKIWQGKPLSEAKTHTAHYGTVLDTQNQPLDDCVATVFVSPKSFTGQNTVEFAVHGSKYIQRELLNSLIAAGARLALPGEFTRRALISGRVDLTQAEAIADMIATDSRASQRIAMSQMNGSYRNHISALRENLLHLVSLLELELDFAEEDVNFADRKELKSKTVDILNHITKLLASFATGNAIKNGIPVAIAGPANAGKSSLLNALVNNDRAIVTDIPGTTRDTIEETAEIGDYLFRFIDTAGLRDTADPIEKLGIDRSHKAVKNALIIISVIDATKPEEGREKANEVAKMLMPGQIHIIVHNKTDIVVASTDGREISISAKTGRGIEGLKDEMVGRMDIMLNKSNASDGEEDILITNQRHAEAFKRAAEGAKTMIDAIDGGISTELVAQDARAVLNALAEITGEITTTEVLSNIFSHFCIGK